MSGKPQAKAPRAAALGVDEQVALDEDAAIALDEAVQLQSELDSLSEKCAEEILQVEQKFNRLRKPFVELRTEKLRAVPDFWMNALLNHPQLSDIISDEDEAIFQSLHYIEVEEDDDVKSGCKIHFIFKKNDYFENEVLTKEFLIDPNNSEPASQGTKINWKLGRKKQDGDGQAGQKRGHEDADSFFDWFTDHSVASADAVAEIIKDDLWPSPLGYYLSNDTSVEAYEGDPEDDEEYEEEEQTLDDEDEDGDPEDDV